MPKSPVKSDRVFLNIPYDPRFETLYLAYLVGLNALGLKPRSALEVPTSNRRLDRILELIRSCRYSVHDLSWVRLDRKRPCTPRFNMPFELGLAVAWQFAGNGRHDFFCFEAERLRLQKSLSDLNGTDPQVHGNTVQGVMRGLGNAFVRQRAQPSVPAMMREYRRLRRMVPGIRQRLGTRDLYQTRAFAMLNVAAAQSGVGEATFD